MSVPLSVSWERAQAIAYSDFLFNDQLTVTYKRPSLEPDVTGFTKPFTWQIWVLLLLSILVVLLVAVTLLKISRAYVTSGQEMVIKGLDESSSNKSIELMKETPRVGDFSINVKWVISIILAQSLPPLPMGGKSFYSMVALWLMVALIMGNVYKSNLKAMLIKPQISTAFNNLKELGETQIPLFVSQGSLAHDFIQHAEKGSILGNLQNQLVPGQLSRSLVPRLRSGQLASISTKNSIMSSLHNTYKMERKCHMYMIDGFFGSNLISYAFPKKSALKEKIDPILLSLKESGIVNHLLESTLNNAKNCMGQIDAPAGDASNLRPLAVGDYLGVFAIYGSGMLIATAIFIKELIKGRMCHSN